MLHFETVLKLHEAAKEENQIWILVRTDKNYEGYRVGKISLENDIYIAKISDLMFNKYHIKKNLFKRGQFYGIYKSKSVDFAAEIIIKYLSKFLISEKGEFADLFDSSEITSYLQKNKLDYVIFKEY